MLCFSDSKIALQGEFFFLGYVVGSLVWMRLTDYWGRKWMISMGLVLFILTLTVYLLKISTYTIYVTLFLMGI